MRQHISIEESYKACFAFLQKYKDLLEASPEGISTLLSDMLLLEDSQRSADPVVWEDWLECVEKAEKQEVDVQLGLTSK